MQQPTDEPTFAEFFAGIGLVRTGLAGGAWQCLYANDIDSAKHRMYAAAFPGEDHYHLGDVWDTQAVTRRIVGRPTLATASSPCTDLSTAGYYKGLSGSQSSAFFGFARALAELRREGRQPPLVLFENVPGLLTSRGGADFATVVRTLADLGYFIDAIIVDAKHFLPQSRPRLFVIGAVVDALPDWAVRREPVRVFGDLWDDRVDARQDVRPRRLAEAMRSVAVSTGWVAFPLPVLPERRTTLGALLDPDATADWWPSDRIAVHSGMMSDRHIAVVARLLRTPGRHVGTAYRRRRHGQMRAEVRFDGLAGCLRTPKGGSARQIVVVIEGDRMRMRWMSPAEYAKLQGAGPVPPGIPATAAMFGYADGVCVPVIEWIDRHLLTPLAQGVAPHLGAFEAIPVQTELARTSV